MPSPMYSLRHRSAATLASIGIHGAALIVLLLFGLHFRSTVAVVLPFESIAGNQSAGGSHAIPLLLSRMRTAARTSQPAPFAEAAPKSILPATVHERKKPGGGSPSTPHSGDGSGAAAAGNGADNQNAKPAFPIFSPRPPVTDRAMLPASVQKIVVDVDLDAAGAVVNEKLITGLGNELDRIVMDTVKSWRFQPATVDGKPVPAQAELIFPFDRNYPITFS